uniref:Uncharacterized protein n=1 Tax=Romanomermis culicivorax TaxID=13658 RepID=A0A915IZF2_ROMCU
MWSKFVENAKVKLSVELIRSYNDDPDLADFLNFVQEEFKCCGLSDRGFEEWSENAYYNCTKENLDVRRCGVPHSCCKDWKNLEKSRSNYYCGYKVRTIESGGRILRHGANEVGPVLMKVLVVLEKLDANLNDRIYVTGCIEMVVSAIKDNILLFSLSAFGFALLP